MNYLNERHAKIISLLQKESFVSVQELSNQLNVSLVTIRKDLNHLEKDGLLHRTHGGASQKATYAYELDIYEKENVNIEKKKKIAKEALKYIHPNDFIIFASGTTIHYLSRAMEDNFEKLMVVTASLRVAVELCKLKTVEVIHLGGEIRKSSASSIGAISEDILDRFSCNKLFLGVDGVDLNFGISTSNVAEAHLNKKMIERSEKVVVVTDSSKIGKRGFGHISGIDAVDTLITDTGISPDFAKKIEDKGINLVIV